MRRRRRTRRASPASGATATRTRSSSGAARTSGTDLAVHDAPPDVLAHMEASARGNDRRTPSRGVTTAIRTGRSRMA